MLPKHGNSCTPRPDPPYLPDAFDFLPVLKRGDSYAVCLDGGVRFGGFPFRGQVRFIG